jgi:phage baseplate assembly protein W|tara:strand:+ start:32426 stop:32794 length:369 start_codon:yes stop_codon:yes gene_type:complete
MSSLSVRLPLRRDSDDGYKMIKSIQGMVKQNFKMLLLTIPGERVMIPEYGVGLPRYLFELPSSNLEQNISSKINEQVDKYMPYLRIDNMQFNTLANEPNSLHIEITYSIPSLNFRDLLALTI